MDLSRIPKVVLTEHLLPNLKWNDLLRLRRVSMAMKDTVDLFINLKSNEDLAPELEINEAEKSLGAFLEMGIPTTKIFFNNPSGSEFYETAGANLARFVDELGPHVKHLRVKQISHFSWKKERIIYQAFPNLETFVAGFIGGWNESQGRVSEEEVARIFNEENRMASEDPDLPNHKFLFPDTFKQLKKVQIGNHTWIPLNCVNIISLELMMHCSSLEHVSLPLNRNPMDPSIFKLYGLEDATPNAAIAPLPLMFRYMKFFLNKIDREGVRAAQNLKLVDFVSFVEKDKKFRVIFGQDFWGGWYFLEFCDACIKWNVKLMNVDSYWFQFRHQATRRVLNLQNWSMPILSLVNLHSSIVTLEMPNLERIRINKTSVSSPGENWRVDRRDWSSLKSLDITVDSMISQTTQVCGDDQFGFYSRFTETSDLFDFFFLDVSRPSMCELRLHFDECERGQICVALPNFHDIVSSCPNLKILSLVKWPCSADLNNGLRQLWRGLPALEEISLEYCTDLSDEAFVEGNEGDLCFSKLLNLRKLTLKGLDKMPKITDILFTCVIRHIGLTHLTLTSDDPVKSVTATGIHSLLRGTFAHSIQKFPFHTWSLKDVPTEDLKSIEKLFRSSDML